MKLSNIKRLVGTLGVLTVLDETANGKIFFVEFIKKDGSIRRMTARRRVAIGVNGKGMSYKPLPKGLMTVYDMDNKGFKLINLLSITRLSANGTKYIK
jgi:hypothetical protein